MKWLFILLAFVSIGCSPQRSETIASRTPEVTSELEVTAPSLESSMEVSSDLNSPVGAEGGTAVGLPATPITLEQGLTPTRTVEAGPRWYLLGRPGGPANYGIGLSISRDNSQYQYVHFPTEGLLVSANGGQSWTNVYSAIVAAGAHEPVDQWNLDIAVQPGHEKSLMAFTTREVFKSEDAGSTWKKVLERPVVHDVEFSAKGQRVYAIVDSGIIVSNDSGMSWTNGLANSGGGELIPDVEDDSLVYAVMGSKLFVSRDAGDSWVTPELLSAVFVRTVVADGSISQQAYALTAEYSLYRTADGGRSWGLVADLSDYTNPFADYAGRSVPLIAADDGRVLYPNTFAEGGTLVIPEGAEAPDPCSVSLAISKDSGVSWSDSGFLPYLNRTDVVGGACAEIVDLILEDDSVVALISYGNSHLNMVRSEDLGQIWHLLPPVYERNSIASSDDGDVIYTTGYHTYKSEDRGTTWTDVHGEWDYTYDEIALGRNDPNVAFVAVGDSFYGYLNILRTTDRGVSWTPVLDTRVRPNTSDSDVEEHRVVIEGSDEQTLDVQSYLERLNCGSGSFGQALEVSPEDAAVLYLGVPGLMTTTSGRDWSVIMSNGSSSCSTSFYQIAVNPTNARQLLLASSDGLYGSDDAGTTVQRRGLGADFLIQDIVYDRTNGNRVFVLAVARGELGLYRSLDGGFAWEPIYEFEGIAIEDWSTPIELHIDRQNVDQLYLLLKDVYRSLDGGLSWEKLALGLSPSEVLRDIALVQGNAPTLFAVGRSGVWKIDLSES